MEEGLHLRAIGKRLQDAGYRTAYIGKLLNKHSRYVAAFGVDETKGNLLLGWDEYHVLMRNKYYGYTMHEQGRLVQRPRDEDFYQTDEIERLATEYIYDAAMDRKPFLLFIATTAPHEPARPAARHARLFKNERAPRISSFNEADVSGQPGVTDNTLLTEKQIATIDARYRDHIRSLQAVDDLMGWLISALEETGQLENTFLFFMSDNGLHFGEHRMFWGKGTTILDLIGLLPEEGVDGNSIAPLLLSGEDDPAWRNAILLESRHPNRNQGVPPFRAIRTERFKWIEYDDGGRALYDLESDPHEMTNLLRGGEWKGVARNLSARLRDLADCVGAGCWEVESRPLEAEIGGK
jgi:arylsulfatase A-like enzyme